MAIQPRPQRFPKRKRKATHALAHSQKESEQWQNDLQLFRVESALGAKLLPSHLESLSSMNKQKSWLGGVAIPLKLGGVKLTLYPGAKNEGGTVLPIPPKLVLFPPFVYRRGRGAGISA